MNGKHYCEYFSVASQRQFNNLHSRHFFFLIGLKIIYCYRSFQNNFAISLFRNCCVKGVENRSTIMNIRCNYVTQFLLQIMMDSPEYEFDYCISKHSPLALDRDSIGIIFCVYFMLTSALKQNRLAHFKENVFLHNRKDF